jgi:UDP-glucose 4-epimerase
MVSIYLAQMLADNKIIIKGSSNRFRDFIYIDDVVQLTMLIISSEISIGKVYNIGTGVKTTVQDVLDKLIKLHGKEIKIKFIDPTPGDQLGIRANTELLHNDFKINDLVDFNRGLKQMVNWAKNSIV